MVLWNGPETLIMNSIIRNKEVFAFDPRSIIFRLLTKSFWEKFEDRSTEPRVCSEEKGFIRPVVAD